MRLTTLGSLIVGLALASPAGAADVRVTIAAGTVSVSAKDATAAQILSEWARVGQMRVVNAERLPGTPMTIELTNVSEASALDTVLRSAGGYLAAPRAVSLPNASSYDRVFVLASSSGAPSRPVNGPATAAFAPPVFQPPVDDQLDQPMPDTPRQAPPGLPGIGAGVPQRGGPPFGQPPIQPPIQAPVQTPAQGIPTFGAAPGQVIGAPGQMVTTPGQVGVSTPGMLVPAPQQPGQPRPVNP